ncbi:MAG: hypothetical protein IPM21_08160 [Acidobacteria bacterium]|nr:hypothetical protein [Acidobacteriota bacterium]
MNRKELQSRRPDPISSLNISTYISLYTYGYRNVYELGPLVDIGATKLEMVAPADTRD